MLQKSMPTDPGLPTLNAFSVYKLSSNMQYFQEVILLKFFNPTIPVEPDIEITSILKIPTK